MDKASGVYLTITDNSFQASGTSTLNVVIPMLTTKGKLGLNTVNANNFKNILGYDLIYNSNYEGLSRILESVSSAKVWRLNQGAKIANAYFETDGSDKTSMDDAESFDEIVNLDPKPALAVSLKDVGDPQNTAIKLSPTYDLETIPNDYPTSSTPQIISFDDVSEAEKFMFGEVEVKGGCLFYNNSNNTLVGIIKPNFNDELCLYQIADGEIIDDVINKITSNVWTDGTVFYDSTMEETTEPEGIPGPLTSLGIVRESTYNRTNEVWTYDSHFFDSNIEETVEPEGTAGTAVSLGEMYICSESRPHLVTGYKYITNDVGTNYYRLISLADTFENCQKTLIEDADEIAELATLYTDAEFKEISYVPYTETLETGFYQYKIDSWYKVLSFTTVGINATTIPESNASIIAALEGATNIEISLCTYTKEELAQDNSCGTAEWEGEKLNLILNKPFSKDSYWTVRTIPTAIKNWTLTESYVTDDNQYLVQGEYNFSTDRDSDIYFTKVDFGELNFFVQSDILPSWEQVRSYFTLDNGSNGDVNLVATEIDTSVLDTCGCNVLAMNGITAYKIINRIAAKCEKLFIHVFADAPAYASYTDLNMWMKNLYQSEYLAVGCRPDQTEIGDEEYIYVYPSVNYVAILSRMITQYQSLNYPPAGFTYGTISVENLITCDYPNYADDLKTNRMNWQRTESMGSVMWEQRTTYALNTDLSYIAPTFIVDSLREQLINFEMQFNFRYTTPTDLFNQESGIKSILDDFVTRGFIYRYDLKVPSYQEAQEAGRILVIEIGVSIAKDSEVIYININLNS